MSVVSFRNKGFTLIELLVVISVIGVLTAFLLPNFVGVRNRASDAKIKNDLAQLKKALRIYYNDYQTYPADNDGGTMMGCGADGDSACSQAGSFDANGVVYMKQLPTLFTYEQTNTGEGFLLSADLDNASDEDIATSQSKCGGAVAANTYYECSD